MTFIFDVTPFVIVAVLIGGLILFVGLHLLVSLLIRLIWCPLKHWKTGLKLYRFERQAFNNRIIKELWLTDDKAARQYQCEGDFYGFCTREIYPKVEYLDDREKKN